MTTDWVDSLLGLDGLMALVLLLSLSLGVWRGLVFELMSLAGWVLAWMAASLGGEALGARMVNHLPDSMLRSAAGFVVAFVVALVGCSLLAHLAKMLISASPLKVIDRVLGAVFGALRGVLILVVLVTVAEWTPVVHADWWQGSTGVAWISMLRQQVQPWWTQDAPGTERGT